MYFTAPLQSMHICLKFKGKILPQKLHIFKNIVLNNRNILNVNLERQEEAV